MDRLELSNRRQVLTEVLMMCVSSGGVQSGLFIKYPVLKNLIKLLLLVWHYRNTIGKALNHPSH